ncbi:MAG: GatB/YqeY domain-containing protein [Microcystaceae cyanobacterium]
MLNSKQVEQLLSKTIKKTISSNGISLSTRKGNKELGLLTKKIARYSFASSEEVINYGEKMGEAIANLAKQKGKENLDVGVIRQISFTSPEIAKLVKTNPAKEVVTDSTEKEEAIIAETVENRVESTEEATVTEANQKEVDDNEQSQTTTLSLKDRIGEDIKTAMKAKDKVKLNTVRAIKKAILEKEVELRPSGQETLTPEQELALLSQQAKQRRDSIEQYEKGNREDLAAKEAQELAIIETYLPPQLSEQELEEIVTKIIADIGATSPKEMGKVMGVAMKQLKGKTDGKKVQAMVQSKLK